jgi:hypothetical protein
MSSFVFILLLQAKLNNNHLFLRDFMHNQQLDLPVFDYRFKEEGGKKCLFDVFRKKFVVLTPEEWVRQHLLQHLWSNLGFPMAFISVEKSFLVDGLQKRYDAVIYNRDFKPLLLIECKSPAVAVDQVVFDQAARYNRSLQVPFMLVSNGLTHVLAQVDAAAGRYVFANGLLSYDALIAAQ